MPVPIVHFTKMMTAEDRQVSLNKIRDWCISPEAAESKGKVAVLQHIVDYASKHLITSSRLSFMYALKEDDDSYYQTCDLILRHADLPELLFMQHVINQVSLVKPGENMLRENLLSLAQKNKETLIVPVVHHTRKAGIAIGCFSLVTRFSLGVLAGGFAVAFSEQIVNWRLAKSLEYKIALKDAGGIIPRIEDGYDDALSGFVHATTKSYHTVSTLFKTVVLPAVMAEKKEPVTHSMTKK